MVLRDIPWPSVALQITLEIKLYLEFVSHLFEDGEKYTNFSFFNSIFLIKKYHEVRKKGKVIKCF